MAALDSDELAQLARCFERVPDAQYAVLERCIDQSARAVVETGSESYSYLTAGRGERPLVLIPAAMISPLMWFHVIETLTSTHRIIVPSVPRTGFRSAQAAVSTVEAILQAESIDRASIVGYSYGGGVAQYVAECNPDSVDTLVLSHTAMLRRDGALRRAERAATVVRRLPNPAVRAIIAARTRSGKASDWYRFRQAFFRWAGSEATKRHYVEFLENSARFYRDVEHLPIGEVRFTGRTVVLGTRSDRDTFAYHQPLVDLYETSEGHVFDEPGGHHMLFLYPEPYSACLQSVLG
ncbi:MAG: alpha/beta hydrolase [Actinomycetota bacterium]